MAALAPTLAGPSRGAGTVTGHHVVSGALLPGLALDGGTGVVAGTLEAAGTSPGQSWTVRIAATLTRGSFTGELGTDLRFTRLR